jgi:Protein of unknown function (DUF3435)
MNRHRDHLAPSSLTDGQLEGIRDSHRIRRLQEKRLALKEMRALHGTLKKAKSLDPDRFKEHEVVVRELARRGKGNKEARARVTDSQVLVNLLNAVSQSQVRRAIASRALCITKKVSRARDLIASWACD